MYSKLSFKNAAVDWAKKTQIPISQPPQSYRYWIIAIGANHLIVSSLEAVSEHCCWLFSSSTSESKGEIDRLVDTAECKWTLIHLQRVSGEDDKVIGSIIKINRPALINARGKRLSINSSNCPMNFYLHKVAICHAYWATQRDRERERDGSRESKSKMRMELKEGATKMGPSGAHSTSSIGF